MCDYDTEDMSLFVTGNFVTGNFVSYGMVAAVVQLPELSHVPEGVRYKISASVQPRVWH